MGLKKLNKIHNILIFFIIFSMVIVSTITPVKAATQLTVYLKASASTFVEGSRPKYTLSGKGVYTVQYRLYIYSYNTRKTTALTKGYTSYLKTNKPYTFAPYYNYKAGRYKVTLYARLKGSRKSYDAASYIYLTVNKKPASTSTPVVVVPMVKLNEISVQDFTKLLLEKMGYSNISNPITKAKELGLIKDGEYIIYERPIARREVARMVARAFKTEYPYDLSVYRNEVHRLQMLAGNVSLTFDQIKNGTQYYNPVCNLMNPYFQELNKYRGQIKDIYKITEDYQDFVVFAYSRGIMNLYSDNTFKAYNNITKDEMNSVLTKAFDSSKRDIVQAQNLPMPTVAAPKNKADWAFIYPYVSKRLYEYTYNLRNRDIPGRIEDLVKNVAYLFKKDFINNLTFAYNYTINDVNTVKNFAKTEYSVNYKTINTDSFKKDYQYYFSPGVPTKYSNYKISEWPETNISNYINSIKQNKIISQAEFISSESLAYGRDDGIDMIRGTLRVIYYSADPNFLKANNIQLGKWYERDIDYSFGIFGQFGYKANRWSHSNYSFYQQCNLSGFRELK